MSSFQDAVQQYNLPSRVRCDLGFENLEVGRFMLDQKGLDQKEAALSQVYQSTTRE